MKMVNPAKVDTVRSLVDEEVARVAIEQGVSRLAAYLIIANELGYTLRAFSGNEGWVCVIALSSVAAFEASVEAMAQQMQDALVPIQTELDELSAAIDTGLKTLDRDLDIIPIEEGRQRLADIRSYIGQQARLRKHAARTTERLLREFVKAVARELQKAMVVLGVSTESAIIAAILLMLDSQCDAFLTRTEVHSLYTRQDLRRRAGSLRPIALGQQMTEISLLDEKHPLPLRILALSLAHLVNGNLLLDIDNEQD